MALVISAFSTIEVIEVLMGRHFFVEPPNCYATFTYGGQEYNTDTHHNATNPPLGGRKFAGVLLGGSLGD